MMYLQHKIGCEDNLVRNFLRRPVLSLSKTLHQFPLERILRCLVFPMNPVSLIELR